MSRFTIITAKVTAKAKQNKIVNIGGQYKIWVTAAPEKGKANAAVTELLAEYLKVTKSSLTLISGATSRLKKYHRAIK